MKKMYLLDISNAEFSSKEITKLFEGVWEIPVVEGTFCNDYDVMEADMPEDIVERLRTYAEKSDGWIIPEPFKTERDFMPMGFNKKNLPKGAVLREIKA